MSTARPATAELEPPVAAVAVALEAEGLSHRYGDRVGLAPLGFSLASPGVAAITGPNGSGKSTLLRIVSGLLRPSAGEVRLQVGGRAVGPGERRRIVGLAAPELAFYEELTAGENLEFVAAARGLPERRRAIATALARVGLEARARDRVQAFSSGMKQRLRLAFALLHEPPLLLLDEPGSHLDEEGRALVSSIVEGQGRAGLVLVATNDEREARHAERRIELGGRGLGDSA